LALIDVFRCNPTLGCDIVAVVADVITGLESVGRPVAVLLSLLLLLVLLFARVDEDAVVAVFTLCLDDHDDEASGTLGRIVMNDAWNQRKDC
jgi:hypothetical protein